MKPRRFCIIVGLLVAGVQICSPAWGQQTLAQQLAVIEEHVNQLREEIKAFQEQMQQQIRDLQTQVTELRRPGNAVSNADLDALDARIKAVDAARERDKQVILDQLAKELVALSGAKSGTGSATAPGGTEHVVKTGETLSTIARQYGVNVTDLARANGITDINVLRVGQKLTIPK
jgi:nucleoid-associated protein YgaU